MRGFFAGYSVGGRGWDLIKKLPFIAEAQGLLILNNYSFHLRRVKTLRFCDVHVSFAKAVGFNPPRINGTIYL